MYHFNCWLHCNKYLILFYTVDLYALCYGLMPQIYVHSSSEQFKLDNFHRKTTVLWLYSFPLAKQQILQLGSKFQKNAGKLWVTSYHFIIVVFVPIWPILCWWNVKPYSINQSMYSLQVAFARQNDQQDSEVLDACLSGRVWVQRVSLFTASAPFYKLVNK